MPTSNTQEGGNFQQGLIDLPVFSVSIGSPALGTTTAVHAAVTLPATGTTIVTTAITNPDVPRNLTITGSASGITGNVVIAGTDAEGVALTETIAASGTGTVVGAKAFKTVTSITVPAKTNSSGDTIAIGTGAKLGLGHRLSRDSVLRAFLAGVKEGTAPTVVFSSTSISGNTVALSSALGATAVIIDYYRS